MYTKAIEADPANHVYYSNRSAAYLKKGDAANALVDAEKCLELNADFEKGYSRKGAALHGLKKYDESIAALEEGLAKFPDGKLKDELAKVRLAKESASNISQAARNSKASMMASQSRQKKAASSESLSSFVTHAKLSLELQIFALQAQLELVGALAEMTDEQKMHMLFNLVDVDQDGRVDARELAEAIKKRNSELTLAESVDRAISMVAAFDEDHDTRLDFDEFSAFITTFAETMEVSFHEVGEFLILQNLFEEGNSVEETIVGVLAEKDMNEAVLEKEEMYDAMTDPRMIALFALFDKVRFFAFVVLSFSSLF
jgi:Ca2+-binding EF-hand superfamily protein